MLPVVNTGPYSWEEPVSYVAANPAAHSGSHFVVVRNPGVQPVRSG